jgi:DNA-binding CsgD family transcriptional regulator
MARCLDLLQQPTLQFMEQVAYPLVVQDEGGVVVWVNEAFCRYFSAKREMVVGRLAAGQLPEVARTAYLEWSRVWREGGPTPGRLMIRMRNGELRAHWVLGQPIADANGRPTGGAVLAILEERALGDAIVEGFRRAGRIVDDVLVSLGKEVERALGQAGPAHVDFTDLRERIPALSQLSDREWSVARRIGRGDRTAIVATDLGITASTVRNHLKAIYRKTGIRSQVELVQHLRAWYREVGGGA